MGDSKNIVSWFELPVSDINRAKTFYETIFGIELTLMELGETFKMAVFPGEQSVVGGALVWNEEWYKPSNIHGPLIHLNANPDLQTVQDKIENAGGKVTIPKRGIGPGRGFMAVFEDSEGNRVALHSDS
ncbi:MAG: VOC family protein [Balneolaceae bacterium]